MVKLKISSIRLVDVLAKISNLVSSYVKTKFETTTIDVLDVTMDCEEMNREEMDSIYNKYGDAEHVQRIFDVELR